MDGLVKRYQKAIEQVDFILTVERSVTPITFNHYFNDNLENGELTRATFRAAS